MQVGDHKEGGGHQRRSYDKLWVELQHQQESWPTERFVEDLSRREKDKTNTKVKPTGTGMIHYGWVSRDQMTIKPKNAQARDTCKDKSITQAQVHKNPDPAQ
jgi:hypothetical protein